ncbi:hypothetical protein F5J12DRAFT_270867 [Pisolithus orientalis]|uniref:uncharacterized protein n=1 Tax=Pisolithus orientalis TaxID=936130 RepID=UPI002224EA76|nr:uncharacterized protein F5J12DRAFT_270867 [Pisolithus orientalis]KAI5999874.1 hypothetical protein F5J12DRAFT_270867 [Pisolithus orientalis]
MRRIPVSVYWLLQGNRLASTILWRSGVCLAVITRQWHRWELSSGGRSPSDELRAVIVRTVSIKHVLLILPTAATCQTRRFFVLQTTDWRSSIQSQGGDDNLDGISLKK